MYTIDDENHDLEEEEYENTWDNRRGLVFKIIVIILCVIVLVLLVKALKSNRNSDNGEIHLANVEKVRLAAEDYFFIKKNKENTSSVTLGELKNAGLVNEIVDANNKACSDSASVVNLDKEVDSYTMKVKLACSTNDKEETFYYHRNTLACLNCNGKTHMDGTSVVIIDPTPTPTVTPTPNNDYPYRCNEWSEWTKERVTDPILSERVKVLVLGVKPGKTITKYGDWSEYTTKPIKETSKLQVESKVVSEEVWSEDKTSSDIDPTNSNIRIVSENTMGDTYTTTVCKGYETNNVCYGNEQVGNLTYREYNSGNYLIDSCTGVKTLKNSEGVYVPTYLNCHYRQKSDYTTQNVNNTYIVYTYQEKETKDVTYYRSRSINTTTEKEEYTTKKYEEDDLPEGFTKVDGSEETYYSYRVTYCEK